MGLHYLKGDNTKIQPFWGREFTKIQGGLNLCQNNEVMLPKYNHFFGARNYFSGMKIFIYLGHHVLKMRIALTFYFRGRGRMVIFVKPCYFCETLINFCETFVLTLYVGLNTK